MSQWKQAVPIHAQTACHWGHLLHVDLLAAHPSGLIWCPSDTICSSAVRQASYMTSKSTRRDCFSLLITSPCHSASCYSIQQQLLSGLSHSPRIGDNEPLACGSCGLWDLAKNPRLLLREITTKLFSFNTLQVRKINHILVHESAGLYTVLHCA